MGFFGDLFSSGIEGVAKGVGSLAKDLRTAITGEEPLTSEQQINILTQVNQLEQMTANLETVAAQGQIELNKIDAQSNSLFKGGWRPYLGWTCGFGFSYTFIIRPIFPWVVDIILQLCNLYAEQPIFFEVPAMPALETGELMSLTLALLGMGGIRMYEKVKGVASK